MKTNKTILLSILSIAVAAAHFTSSASGNTLVYTNKADTNWFSATNWSPNQVPGAGDTVMITNGTVGINAAATVGTLNLSGGTLNAPFGLTVQSGGNWTGGVLSGQMTVGRAATFNLSNPGGTLNFPGTTLTNLGTVIWSGGTLRGNGGTVVNNNGSWMVSGVNDQFNNAYGGAPAFINNGTLTVQNAAAQTVTFSGVAFTNNFNAANAVDAQSGTLLFEGGGLLNGGFQAEAGATIRFDQVSSAPFSTGPNFRCAGPGAIQLTGGAITLANDQAGLGLMGGTVTLGPNFQSGGAITNLTLNGSSLQGTNTLAGTMNWLAGSISGVFTISSAGALNLGGAASVTQYAALTNAGHIAWNGSGDWTLYNDGAANNGLIVNLAGGVIDAQCNNQMRYGYGYEWFSNAGLFRKTASTGTTVINVVFTNTGTVAVQSGELDFNRGSGNYGGVFQAANGTVLKFNSGGILSGSFTAGFGAGIGFYGGTFSEVPPVAFGGAGTVALNGGTLTLLGDINPNLQLNGGALNLPAGFQGGTITNLTVAGITINGTNTVTGLLNLNGGASGPLVVAAGGVVNWSGGTLSRGVTVSPGGVLNITGPSSDYAAGMTNGGTINWTGGYVELLYGSTFYNLAGGVFNIECDNDFYYYSGGETINNAGLVQKLGTTGRTTMEINLINSGVVVAQSGTLEFYNYYNGQNGILGGTFQADAGATLQFDEGGNLTGSFTSAAGGRILLESGTFTPAPTMVFNGPGTNTMAGGTITLTNDLIANLQLTGGTVVLTPTFQGGAITNLTLNGASLGGANTNTVTGVLNLYGTLSGPLTVVSNATLNLNGSITAPLTLLPGATMNWSNGYLESPLTIPANAVLNVVGPGTVYVYNSSLTNAGTVNWTGGSLYIYSYYGSAFYNLAGATLNIQSNVSGSGGGVFNNAGLVRQWLTSGQSSLNWIFNNTGLVDVQTGTLAVEGPIQNSNAGGTYEAEAGATLNFSGGGYLTGEFTAAGAGTMDFSGGTFTNTTSTVLDGVGAHILNGGTWNLLYDFPPNLQLLSGNINPGSIYQGGSIVNLTLNGLGLVGSNTVTGVLNLHGDLSGPLTVAGNATASVTGNINSSASVTLQPGATFNWTGADVYAPVTVQAGAVWNLAPSNYGYFEAPVTNWGTINWSGGYLELENYYYYYYGYNYLGDIFNLAGATFNVLTDQPIYQYSGGLIENDGLFRKSGASGTNSIQAIFTNKGTIDVECGRLQFTGTFGQTGGTWDFGINGAGSNGSIGFNGVAPLPGVLNVTANNGYLPGLSNSFTLAAYGSFTGNIAATNLPADGAAWQLNYGSGALSLVATNLAVPAVSITSPANNAVFTAPSSITLSASAVDTNAAISSVQFYQGTSLLGAGQPQIASSTYTYAWNSPAPGVYAVTALATDANGGLAASAPVNITVFPSGQHSVTYTWSGAPATDWFTAANWTPNGVPGALDNVIINSGSPVLLSRNASVNSVLLSSGAIGGAGALTVTNAFTWTGGAVSNTLVISSNATLVINSVNGVTMTNATLVNQGTVQWIRGGIAVGPATIITNGSGALCLLQTDNTATQASAAANGLFVNNGVVRKTAATGTTYLSGVNFVNNGVVDAQSGTISFQSGGALSGIYNTAASAFIRFGGGAFTLDSLPSFTGAGANQFSGGTLTMLHDVAPQLQLTGGSVMLGAAFQNAGAITNLTLAGATLLGTNTVSGTFNCWSGILSGGVLKVAANGLLVLGLTNNYTYVTLQNLSLINAGEVLWQGGYIQAGASPITNNNLWLMRGGYSLTGGSFVNNGLIKQTSASSGSIESQVFINNGAVDAEAGTIGLGGGGTFAGAYNAAAGAAISFVAGSNTLNTLAGLPNFTGLGSFLFSGGMLVMNNDIDPALQLTGGTVLLGTNFQNGGKINNLVIHGSMLGGTNTVTGSLTFAGGSINGPLTVDSNASLTFLPGYLYVYGTGAITNFGSVFCASNTEYLYPEVASVFFVNNGLWLDQGASGFYNSASAFINNGIYRKEGSAATTAFYMPLNNNGLFDVRTGYVYLEGGGVLGGTFNVAAQAYLDLDSGSFTVGLPPANFTGTGSLEFYATLTLTNDVIPSLPLTGGTVLLGPNFQRSGAITNLTLAGATLGGTNFVSGALNLGADSSVSGTLTVLSNGLLTLSGTGYVYFQTGAKLINQGVVDWTGGEIYTYPTAVITNFGLWLVETDNEIYNEYYSYSYPNTPFLNLGTFAKTTTTGTTAFYGIAFLNSGTLDIQSGSVNFAAANYDTNSVAYAQTGATLAFGASAPNLAGRLILSTNISLDGTLEADLLNGYTPTLGDQIPVISFGSASKTGFADLVLPPVTGMTWDVETGASGVNLRVVPAVATTSRLQIGGTVRDANNNPIAGLTVYATQTGVTNLIQNGSFEIPSIGTTGYTYYGSGSTNITGWTVLGRAGSNVELVSLYWAGPAEDGNQFLDPSGSTGDGGVTQSFPTTPGTTYDLIFYHGSYSHYGRNSVLGVTIDTNYYTFGETDGESGNFDWRRVEIQFTASTSLTPLTFQDLSPNNNDDNDSFVDNVQVIPPGFGTVAQAATDTSGNYLMTVPNGSFRVGVDGLPGAGYNNVPEQLVALNGNNNTAVNFSTTPLSGGQFFSVTTSVNPPALGTAFGGGAGLHMGAPVTVSVVQNANPLPYFFAGWTENGVLESSNVNYSFTAFRNRSLVANFALPGLVVTASNNPPADGGVSGAGIYTYNTTSVLTAFPLPGYKFNNWTENGVVVSPNNPLSILVLTNRFLVANYGDANPSHVVIVASSPAGLTTGAGAGTYTNGQTAIITAPSSLTNSGNFYIFQGFTLAGSPVTSAPSFSKSFSTFDPASLTYVAVYQLFPLQPQIIAVRDNYPNPIPATTGFLLTFQFDRSMRTNSAPLVLLTNAAANAVQATVGANGLWTTTALSNDTYQTPGITFGNGMDGNVNVLVSRGQDVYGHGISPPTNVLSLVVHSTRPSPPAVAITSPANGTLLNASQSFAIGGTITSTNFSGGEVDVYTNEVLMGLGVLSAPPASFSFTVSNGLAGGSYSLLAVAVDAGGLTGTSMVTHVTVNNPGSSLIDFEAMDASAGPVGGTMLSNYLARYGVKATNVTPGTSLVAANDEVFLGGKVVQASSRSNFLAQTGANGAVSYTLLFTNLYASVSWVRPQLLAGTTGASLPAWRAHILDSQGNDLGSAGENALGSFNNLPAARFTLLGHTANQSVAANIAAIRFDGNNQGLSSLATLPLDDLLLSITATNTTLAVNLTSPGGTTFAAPAQVVLNAMASDNLGTLSQVSFYEGSNFVSAATPAAGVASLTLNNLAAGNYVFTAVASDSLGAVSSSSPLTVTVTPVKGLTVINFDALNTSAGAVGGVALSNYLFTNFVVLSNVTVGTAMEAVNAGLVTGSGGAGASSPPNYFTQAGLNQPVTFTLVFPSPLQAFGFTRVALLAGAGGVSHPQWTATLLDAKGVALGSAGENLITSATNVPARSFVLTGLNGDGIASVRFDSDSQKTAAFSAVLLDDLIMNGTSASPMPAALSVSLATSLPVTGTSQAPVTDTLTATVTNSLGTNYSVSFYAGPNLVGSVSYPANSVTLSNVLAGTYVLRAQVVDSSGVTAFSSPVTNTVAVTGGNSQVVNFDSPTLNAIKGPVSGAVLSNYLATNGILLTTNNISPGTTLAVENQAAINGGAAVAASSPPNIATQIGSSGPVSYTVSFATWLTNFGFTRPELLANPFVSHPAWQATAFDAAGVALDQKGEGLIGSYTNVGAQAFNLSGPGIASVQFASQGSGLTTFNAMLADDFVLTTNAAGVRFPPAVAITSPPAGLQVTSNVTLTVAAQAASPAGIASVSFYYTNSAAPTPTLIGTATSGPYSVPWVNPSVGGYALMAVALDNNGLSRTSPAVNVTILPPAFSFGIVTPPVSQTAKVGSSVTFSVATTGTGTVTYQWYQNGSMLAGQTASTLTLFPVNAGEAGSYTVTATSGGVTLTSAPPAVLTVAQPPVITTPPADQTVSIGANVVLSVAASGGPFNYQWLLNGAGIPGATNSTYSILAAQPLNSGSYQVVVGNAVAFVQSAPAVVLVQPVNATMQSADNFSNAISINPLLGPVEGNNQNATSEPGEPLHDGKPGGKSIWYTWQASFTGVISLTTRGSDFETLLAVYTGTNVAKLTPVAADDVSGGYWTSLVQFNVTAGTTYQIAVDGFQGASGNVVLGMPSGTAYRVLPPGPGNRVPVITSQPANQLVLPGSTVTLRVGASNALTYQWFFQGAPVGVGGTASSLVITNFQAGSVGLYDVLVANAVGSVESEQATLQIAATNQPGSGGFALPKLGDAVNLAGPPPAHSLSRAPASGGGDTRGFSVSQVFSTIGATKEPGEPNLCGQAGGASEWFVYTAPTNGTLDVNTAGSTFNTILAVYTGPGTNFASLIPQGCGFVTNYVTQGQPNVVIPGVVKGTRFFIAVDGYQGVSGTVKLHIGLGAAPSLVSPPVNQFAVAGSNATFNVTAVGSTNFGYQWQFNGVSIARATNSSYTVTNASSTNVGNYTVIVSNVVATVTSAPPATLTLQYAPAITAQPTNQTVFLGQKAGLAVTVVGVNSKTNPLVYQWYYGNYTNNTVLPKATNSTLAFPAAQYTNNGSYFVTITNNYNTNKSYPVATSSVAVLTVVDTNLPTVAFSAPPNNFSTNVGTLMVTGTAADKYLAVTNVQVAVNQGPFQTVTGTTKWSNLVSLVPGPNTISARSFNLAGTNSLTNTLHLTFLARSRLIVQTNVPGTGRVTSTTGATNGASLLIGQPYTILATPATNYLFTNWTSGTNAGFLTNHPGGPNLTFTMFTNMVMQANFVTNPFLAAVGVYNGLFYPPSVTEASSGFISAAISSNGTYSAKLLLDGGSNYFSGSFDLTGTAQTNLARSGKSAVNVTLILHLYPADALMTGSVSNAGSGLNAVIHADQAVFNTNSYPATNYAGRFTLLLPPGTIAPNGYGYAAITNTLDGASKLGGALADGTPFLWSGRVGQFGNIPLYLSLYSGKGSLLGWIFFTNEPPQNVAANSWVSWIKPAVPGTLYPSGFTNLNLTGVLGSPFTNTPGAPALDLTDATLVLTNGNLAGGALTFTNLNLTGNTLTNLAKGTNFGITNYLLLAISTNNGVVTIYFQATGAKTNTTAHGAVLQNQTDAQGAFPGTNQTGSFILH